MNDTKNSSTVYVIMYELIMYNGSGCWTRTGGWDYLLPLGWHILTIPLETGRGISAKTRGLDDVFPPDDLGSGP